MEVKPIFVTLCGPAYEELRDVAHIVIIAHHSASKQGFIILTRLVCGGNH